MKRPEFERRFDDALRQAVTLASNLTGRKFGSPKQAVVHAQGLPGTTMAISAALDHLYLGEDRSYVIIDVGLIVDGPSEGLGWIRASSHNPRADSEIWDPNGLGPFKLIEGVHQANS